MPVCRPESYKERIFHCSQRVCLVCLDILVCRNAGRLSIALSVRLTGVTASFSLLVLHES